MGSRATLQENLKKADLLKEMSLNCQSINNSDNWTTQQTLLNIYEEMLILDLEYALDKKVEQDLWQYCFKNHIALLQSFAKDKKSGSSSNSGGLLQAKLSWFLECASGFYLSLLQQICSVFSLDLPFNRCEGLYGVVEDMERDGRRSLVKQPKRNSCYYVCQYCLVHLGDIARYRNQAAQAESFYKQAVGVGPWSGQPYNQLGLLGANGPDRLSTVFYYVRSIAVPHPFHNALTNLTNTLVKCINYQKEEVSEGKLSSGEYESLLLKLVACLHNGKTEGVPELLAALGLALTPLIATQQFTPWKLIQMATVWMWLWEGDDGGERREEAPVEETVSEFVSTFLTALLLPLYTASSDSILSYFALPTIKVVLTWLECRPSVIEKMIKPSLWRGVCKLLNDLRAANPIPPPQNINDALSEDFDLRGFLPLDAALQDLNYDGDELEESVEKKLRAFRIIKLGEWLANSAPHNPICIRECLFEPAPVDVVAPLTSESTPTPPTSSSLQQPGRGSAPLSEGRHKGRQNVALQSIMRLSNSMRESGGDWQPSQQASTVLTGDPRWWPPGPPVEELPAWSGLQEQMAQNQEGRMYSLFSGGDSQATATSSNLAPSIIKHQSLWSGPGPSPLERLLQQQKNQRSGGTSPADT